MEEIIARLQLLKTNGIGKVTFFHLLKLYGNAKNAIASLNIYNKNRNKHYSPPSLHEITKIINDCKQQKIELIFFDDINYPKELLTTTDYPPLLYCKGNISLLNKPNIAIIGSRLCSLQAQAFTKKIISELKEFCIISGFAKGIDKVAHEAALKTGTIAVFGCGINYIYPEENTELYEKILNNNGLLISEIGINEAPKQNFFSYRNRLISGISKGVVIVEAGFKSGSLITSEYAAEQGKPIFAVPSHPLDPKSIGTNYLIKNGAILTRSAQDILDELDIYKANIEISPLFNFQEDPNLEEVKDHILSQLSYTPILIKDLIYNMSYKIQIINSALAELELDNKIIIEHCFVQKTI